MSSYYFVPNYFGEVEVLVLGFGFGPGFGLGFGLTFGTGLTRFLAITVSIKFLTVLFYIAISHNNRFICKCTKIIPNSKFLGQYFIPP